MARVRKINVSQVEGNSANDNDTNEIRPYGEMGVFQGDYNSNLQQDRLELLMFDGTRTHVKSKVLSPGILYGSNADSGDGYKLDTIKLVPDEVLRRSGSDQYIIVDPTAPNHIHMRAGGTIDGSNADLFLGGEKNHVKVSDISDTVVISVDDNNTGTKQWVFNTIGNLTLPGGSLITSPDYSLNLVSGNDGSSNFGDVNITTNNPLAINTWSFGTMGELTLPATLPTEGGPEIKSVTVTNNTIDYQGIVLTPQPDFASGYGLKIYPGGPVDPEASHLHLTATDPTTVDLFLGDDDKYVKVAADGLVEISGQNGVRLWGEGEMSNTYIYLPNNADSATQSLLVANYGAGGILVQTGNGSPPNNWLFDNTGKLQLPAGGDIVDSNGNTLFVEEILSETNTVGAGVAGTIWTDSNATNTMAKLLVNGVEATTGDSQSCEVLITKKSDNTVVATIYAIVHTSASPLFTVAADWDSGTNRMILDATVPGANNIAFKVKSITL